MKRPLPSILQEMYDRIEKELKEDCKPSEIETRIRNRRHAQDSYLRRKSNQMSQRVIYRPEA